jgi:PKD repeat protein
MPRHTRLAVVLVLAVGGSPACQKETTTQSAPPLKIQCSANPASGQAPLTVAFGLDVANALGALTVAISYGDGTQGTDPDARHVYTAAGDFVASFTVTAGVETARCSVPLSVAPGPAPTPTPAVENRWPDPSFRTTPPASSSGITGKAPFTVQYNLCRSTDPDGDRLYFRMDLDGDGSYEFSGATGADCRHEATYSAGTRTVTLCVTDVDCPSWPLCADRPRLHPFQCESYSVTATP